MSFRGDVKKERTEPFQQHPGKKTGYLNNQILMLRRSGTEWRGQSQPYSAVKQYKKDSSKTST